MADRFTIVETGEGRGEICREILSALPDWFGIPSAVDAYVAEAARLPMLVAKADAVQIAGFVSLKAHSEAAVEAYVLGVRPEWHRRGLGRMLFAAAGEWALARGADYLTVKTLDASHPHAGYRRTRLFYEAIGFQPIEVFPELWGEENPCLLMLKRLR